MKKETLGIDDICAYLGEMPQVSKYAICYCVFQDIAIEEVINLKWTDDVSSVNHRALSVVEIQKPSSSVDYVFWSKEDHSRISTLRWQFEYYSCWIGWRSFRNMFKDAVGIDFQKSIPNR